MSRRRPFAPVTVGALVRSMGVERECEVAWAVGRVAARIWREQNTGAPPVALVRKSGGGGSHHMAVYPPSFRPTLVRLVKLCAAAQAAPRKPARRSRKRQPDLFEHAR